MPPEKTHQPTDIGAPADEVALEPAKITYPLISIWSRPRATMRHIVGTNPKYLVLQLAVLTGVAEVVGNVSPQDFGKEFGIPLTLLFVLVVGSILGVLALYVGGKLLQWSGRWLGGGASLAEIQSALAWSTVPRASTLPILPIAILLNDQPWLGFWIYASPIILLDFWSVFLLVICLGEVQRFSALKALGNIVLGTLTILLPIAIVAGGLWLLQNH